MLAQGMFTPEHPHLSTSARSVEPFFAMEILERAQELERGGASVVHLEVGEPDFPLPPCVEEAVVKAIRDGHTHYTHSLGLWELREEIAAYCGRRYGVQVATERVVVTTGSSGALALVMAMLIDPGDEVLLPDPGYACYPNFIRSFHGRPRPFPLSPSNGFHYDAEGVRDCIGERTRALLVNSPANPTAAIESKETLARLAALEVPVVSDEIYHGLEYGEPAPSMLEVTPDCFVLNGFSKRYAMTGLRIGWLVIPEGYITPLQKLQQNLFICSSSIAQHAALAALRGASADVEVMREEYAKRRLTLLAGLRDLGFPVPAEPMGAYYVLADARHLDRDSLRLAKRILEEAHVGVTPGVDFGPAAEGHLRFSFGLGERAYRRRARSAEDLAGHLRQARPKGRRFMNRFVRTLVCCLALLASTGCPHRSPVWSPDGGRIILLTGSKGEAVDKAASQLWLVSVESGKAKRLQAPEKGVRYLAAAWLDDESFVVFTGKWDDGYVEAESEKTWKVTKDGAHWEALSLPQPTESRAMLRLAVVVGTGTERALVYPSGDEAVVVTDPAAGKERSRIEPAELVGPGPQGGFLITRPEPGDTGGTELVAYDNLLKPLWSRKFSQLRDEIAGKLEKQPVEIVFNDTSTSHRPLGAADGSWVGVTLVFTDVGWRDGISGYYVQLEAASGKVIAAIHGVGLSGRPASSGGAAWAVAAPDSKRGLPARLQALGVRAANEVASNPLKGITKDDVHGYALGPQGQEFAISLTAETPVLELYSKDSPDKPRRIKLESKS